MDFTTACAAITLTLSSGPNAERAATELQTILQAPCPAGPLGGIELEEFRASAPSPTLKESQQALIFTFCESAKDRLGLLEEFQRTSSCYVGTHNVKRLERLRKKERRRTSSAPPSTPTKDQTPA